MKPKANYSSSSNCNDW